MTTDRTQTQGGDEQLRAQQLSVQRTRPPVDLPGYEFRRFLGAGAYGEVWVALDRNTGRQVAIKFYAHRGGLDWSLLSREVEKLAFLSADRYVVQLLDVGWDAEPPYYVMEFLEHGSLDDRLKLEGPIATPLAVEIFRDVAVGLLHAHAKGVLHCDLKPANVLLDQDVKPRLADFGQSRLSHEQTPALGTLFYMAPEQADLKAVPDARWDVYALGALLFCMLTGAPPHRSEAAVTEFESAADLGDRLARYRNLLHQAPLPTEHRRVPGVDRALAEIIDRCLMVDPNKRFPNVQSVLDAIDARDRKRSRRPLLVLGAVGPAVLLAVMGIFAWQWFNMYFNRFSEELQLRALQNNKFAARYVAKVAANELERRFRTVEQLAADRDIQDSLIATLEHPELRPLIIQLSDPVLSEDELSPLREQYLEHRQVRELHRKFGEVASRTGQAEVASWLLNDVRGLQLARIPDSDTIARNWAWRSYFNGQETDRKETWRPGPDDRLRETHLSAAFYSLASNRWAVAVSTPILFRRPGADEQYLGVLSMTVEVGHFIEMRSRHDSEAKFQTSRVPVLIDGRPGKNQGLILQHPLFDRLLSESPKGALPPQLSHYRVTAEELPSDRPGERIKRTTYVDPLSRDPAGSDYDRPWLAELAPVIVRDEPTGWYVIVQEARDAALDDTLGDLRRSLINSGVLALGMIALVISGLWAFVVRPFVQGAYATGVARPGGVTETVHVSDPNTR